MYLAKVLKQNLNTWKNTGAYIEYDNFKHKIFVRSIGNEKAIAANTLLLIHGFPESSYSYCKVVEGLSKIFDRIVLFDFIGFGLSDKPTTNFSYSILEHADTAIEVWKQLGVSGGHLLAHDMGDSVATEIVMRYNQQILDVSFSTGLQSVTFTNGSMLLEFADLRITQKLLLTKFGYWLNKAINQSIFQHQIKSAHGNTGLTKEDIETLWQANILKDGHRKAYLTIRYYLDRKKYEQPKWLPALSATNLPIHLCWGDADAVARIEIAYHLKEKICPNAELTIMKNVGHFCQLSNPEIWLESVEAFYERLK